MGYVPAVGSWEEKGTKKCEDCDKGHITLREMTPKTKKKNRYSSQELTHSEKCIDVCLVYICKIVKVNIHELHLNEWHT